VSRDDKIRPIDQQKPPDPGEFATNYLWEFLKRKFGPLAGVLFLIIMSAIYFHSEIGEIVSDLHTQIVDWWPLPKAKSDVFTVAIARLEDDDEKAHSEVTIARDLRDLGKSNGIAILEFPRVISDQDPKAGHAQARKWLKESGAQVLLWGRVLIVPGKPAVPQLYWTNSQGSNEKNESGRYGLDENLRLPTAFHSDLSDILRLLVVSQGSAFNAEEGRFVADRLRPFIERARHLLEGDATKSWTAKDIARTKLILAKALTIVGDQSADKCTQRGHRSRQRGNHGLYAAAGSARMGDGAEQSRQRTVDSRRARVRHPASDGGGRRLSCGPRGIYAGAGARPTAGRVSRCVWRLKAARAREPAAPKFRCAGVWSSPLP
jgi:hypothetical protein